MTRPEQFTINADGAALRYTTYLETILASYNRTILSKDLTASTIRSFKSEIEMLNKHYLEREVDNIVKYYEALQASVDEDTARLGVKVTEDEEWAEYLSGNTNFAYEAIKLQSTKDAMYAINFMRTKVIELIHMSDFERAYNLVFTSKELDFYYTDKIGRKINSVKYVRTMTRDYHVKNYNDLIAGAGMLNGIDEVTIINSDIHHGDHNKTISINGENTINYFAIRNDTFHPNTNSILRL